MGVWAFEWDERWLAGWLAGTTISAQDMKVTITEDCTLMLGGGLVKAHAVNEG